MPSLSDGTFVPSFLGVETFGGGYAGPSGFFDNVATRAGEVTAIHYPGDPENRSGVEIEYTVLVWHRDRDGGVSRISYHARQADAFGGLSDRLRYAIRAATRSEAGKPLNNGSTVQVVCIDGTHTNAVIVGGVRNPNAQPDPRRARGRFLDFEYNGVSASIEDDGSLKLTVPGATNEDGKPDAKRDEKNKGSTVSFAKDGTILVSDENGESVRITPGSNSIEVLGGGPITIKAKGKVLVQGEQDVTVQAKGKLRLGTDSANENMVLGKKLAQALQELVTVFTTCGVISQTGNLGAPVPINPLIVAQLQQWLMKYIQGASPAAILASDKFTER